MRNSKDQKGRLKFWRQKLTGHQKKYNQLKKQSPGRWWHDEHFDIQMRVLESLITEAQDQIRELKKRVKARSG